MKVSSNRLLYGFALVWCVLIAFLFWNVPAWYDEGITILQLSGTLFEHVPDAVVSGESLSNLLRGDAQWLWQWKALAQTDVHPPLYYWTANVWSMVVGDHLGGVRLFSLLTVVGGALMFFGSLENVRQSAKFFGLVFFLTSPLVLFSASNARGYGLALGLMCVLCFLGHRILIAAEKKDDRSVSRFFFGFILVGYCAFLTHYFTIFATLGYTLAVLPAAWRSAKIKTIGSLCIGIFLLLSVSGFFIPQMSARPEQFSGFQDFWVEVIGSLGSLLIGVSIIPLAHPLWIWFAIFLLVLFFVGARFLFKNQTSYFFFHMLGVCAFFVSIFVLFFIKDKTIIGSTPRYFVFLVPSFVYFLVYAISSILDNKKIKSCFVPYALSLVVLVFVVFFQTWNTVFPFAVFKNSNVEIALSVARDEGALIILPASVRDGAFVIDYLQGKERVYLASSADRMQTALKNIGVSSVVVLLEPAPFRTDLLSVWALQKERLINCDFVETQSFVWRRSTDKVCDFNT